MKRSSQSKGAAMVALLLTSDPPVTAEEDAAWADRQALADLAARFKIDPSSLGPVPVYSGFARAPVSQTACRAATFASPDDVIVLRTGR